MYQFLSSDLTVAVIEKKAPILFAILEQNNLSDDLRDIEERDILIYADLAIVKDGVNISSNLIIFNYLKVRLRQQHIALNEIIGHCKDVTRKRNYPSSKALKETPANVARESVTRFQQKMSSYKEQLHTNLNYIIDSHRLFEAFRLRLNRNCNLYISNVDGFARDITTLVNHKDLVNYIPYVFASYDLYEGLVNDLHTDAKHAGRVFRKLLKNELIGPDDADVEPWLSPFSWLKKLERIVKRSGADANFNDPKWSGARKLLEEEIRELLSAHSVRDKGISTLRNLSNRLSNLKRNLESTYI